ncbi:MAG: hypothetical protein WBK55_09670 [Alphaproteobacteria bacterium]
MRLLESGPITFKPSHADCLEIKRVFDHYVSERNSHDADRFMLPYEALQDTWHYYRARYSQHISQYFLRRRSSYFGLCSGFTDFCIASGIPAIKILDDAGRASMHEPFPLKQH